jgi:predicted Zn-dependent peptidase
VFSILTSCLDNGLKVLLRRIPEQRTVSCGVWVNQGGKNETVEQNGISHLVEHLMFKIKSKNSSTSMTKSMEDLNFIGSKYNAVTTKDYTGFYIDGLKKDITKMLEVLSYIVVNKEPVEVSDLEKEKQIVLREVEGYLTYSKQIGERVGQALWGEHSFGQLVIGNPDTINNIDNEMVDSLIKKAYIPENSVLVVVGGFEFEEVQKDIYKLFGNWEDSVKNIQEPIIHSGQGVYINDLYGGNRSTIGIGFSTYPFTDIRSKYCEILKDILVRPGSRLFNELRENARISLFVIRIFSWGCILRGGNMGVTSPLISETITIQKSLNMHERA